MNESTAADIVLLEAVGDFVSDVKRLIDKVSDDGLFELIVRSLGEEIHLAGRAVSIEGEALKNLELQELGAFAAPILLVFLLIL